MRDLRIVERLKAIERGARPVAPIPHRSAYDGTAFPIWGIVRPEGPRERRRAASSPRLPRDARQGRGTNYLLHDGQTRGDSQTGGRGRYLPAPASACSFGGWPGKEDARLLFTWISPVTRVLASLILRRSSSTRMSEALRSSSALLISATRPVVIPAPPPS